MWSELEKRIVRENRIFIIPSARGFLFLGLSIVMILVAATYNNNLIFILGAFLFSVFVVVLLQTHYNLKGTFLRFISIEEGFEGREVRMAFELSQKRARLKAGLEIRTRGKKWKTLTKDKHDLAATDRTKPVSLGVEAVRRGLHRLPEVVLETYYPLGLFRAWKVYRPEGEFLIYPKPEGLRELKPLSNGDGRRDDGMKASTEGDLGELRPFRSGDSFAQVAWKHFARTGTMHSRLNWGGEERHYAIPWIGTSGGGDKLESDLRQMSAWVERALFEQSQFEMSVPQGHVGLGFGPEHARVCWRALAKIGEGT